jgi:hypothetical protein
LLAAKFEIGSESSKSLSVPAGSLLLIQLASVLAFAATSLSGGAGGVVTIPGCQVFRQRRLVLENSGGEPSGPTVEPFILAADVRQ